LEIVESIGAAGKADSNRVKKYFRLEVNGREMAIWVKYMASVLFHVRFV